MRKRKISIQHFAGVCLLMISIMLSLVFAHYRNQNRNLEFVGRYIDELSKNTAAHVSDVFADKLSSIESIAYLYGEAIESTDANLKLLAALEEKSGFDKIRFIAADGTDYASDGRVTNIKDRAYFQRGMSRESGICEVLQSRINGEKLVGFYAPVSFRDEICGIMVGFLSENTVSGILETHPYSYSADTYISLRDGTVLGRFMADDAFPISNVNETMKFIDEAHRDAVTSAISERENYQFTLSGSKGQSVGCIVSIEGTEWSLMQIFPPEASHIVIKEAFNDALKTFLQITAIFVAFFIFFIYTYRRSEKEKTEELAYNKVNALMRCITEEYVYLIDVDLETQQEVRYRLSSGDNLADWTDGNNDYTYCITEYADTYVAEYDRERFKEATKLETLRAVLSEQTDYYIEYDAVIDGKTLQFQGKFTIPNDKQFENHMVISIRDITDSVKERNAKEKELLEARKMAESANRAKTTFLFNMSHDIRTPMNAIVGFTNLVEQHIDDREKAKNYIKKIKFASEFLLSLINNVLEMARIESGKMELDESVWDVEQFNDMLVSVFEEQFRQKKLKFTREIRITHHVVICDSLKLKEIYLNILSNAMKYTPEGGSISMVLEEIPSEQEEVGIYRCAISDTGIGMSEEFSTHLFEEFSRETSTTESKVGGSGLGMAIVKKLVELMNGTIEVESHLGKGTTVTVMIPHRFAEKSAVENVKKDVLAYAEDSFAGKRVLLVEDNELNAEIAVELLKGIGLETERAADGVECIHMVQENEEDYYDIILMDIQMPNMNGYDAARELRRLDEKKAKIPIIAMTANAFEEDKRNALEAGMNGHIAKPIEIPKLIEALRSCWSKLKNLLCFRLCLCIMSTILF